MGLKLLNGSQMLKPLLPKRSHALFQRNIAELNQPKTKLLLSNKNSKPKLKVGSILKKKNFSLMLQPSKAESFHQLTHGRLTPSLTSEKSRNDSTSSTPKTIERFCRKTQSSIRSILRMFIRRSPQEQVFTDLKNSYKGCVDVKVGDVLAKFDAFWAEWQPQLEDHYECGYKCTVKVTTPCLNIKYNWNFCAPSISSCRFVYC